MINNIIGIGDWVGAGLVCNIFMVWIGLKGLWFGVARRGVVSGFLQIPSIYNYWVLY